MNSLANEAVENRRIGHGRRVLAIVPRLPAGSGLGGANPAEMTDAHERLTRQSPPVGGQPAG